ncbi:MAG: hypothetical protein V3S37_05405 [Dehalococcoidia bacterium]
MQDLNPEDRYQLRKAQMDAGKKALEAQKAQQELERLVLELEHKYDLMTTGQTVDPMTASISGSPAIRKSNGKEPILALEAAVAHEAAG